MKKLSTVLLAFCFAGVVYLGMVFVITQKSEARRADNVGTSAEQLAEIIQKFTVDYQHAYKEAKPHIEEIARREAKLVPINERMDLAAEKAAGLDYTLCVMGLRYVRGTDKGIFYKVTEPCDPLQ